MGQFFISEVGDIHFDCDCGNPLQPIVDKKQKTIKCKKCGDTFTNPLHKSNPYNIDSRYIYPLKIQGIELTNSYKILRIIILLSFLSGFVVFFLNFEYNISPLNILFLDVFLPTIIIAIITLVSMVSIFAIFGKNQMLESKRDIAKSIETRIRKYSKKVVSLSNILHYKFDTKVLEGLKKDNIDSGDWFLDFIYIETYDELESKVIEGRLNKRIIPLCLAITIISISLLPFSPVFNSIQSLEISIITFLSLFSIWEIFTSFNYILTVLGIVSIDRKLMYWKAPGEKGLRVSRIIDMKQVKIYR